MNEQDEPENRIVAKVELTLAERGVIFEGLDRISQYYDELMRGGNLGDGIVWKMGVIHSVIEKLRYSEVAV